MPYIRHKGGTLRDGTDAHPRSIKQPESVSYCPAYDEVSPVLPSDIAH